jgi:hypothetical protein
MLATQDVQLSAGAQAAEDVTYALHQVDLWLLRASDAAARFAATNEYDAQGYASPIDWIRFTCHQTSTVAADLIAVGKTRERVPESTQAVSNGEIGFAHLKAMARTAVAVGSKFDEPELLTKARENSPGKFYYLCNHYRHSADRRGYEAEQADMVENRKLWISTGEDGAVWINGVLDPIGGATIRTAFEPLARRLGKHDDRCREKRMADALVDLSMHALDSGMIPQQAAQRTHLQITASLETLQGLPGAPGADMEFSPMPVPTKTVERLACDASFTRILLDSKSVVIDVARAKRTVSGPARKALNIRDRGCTWPGCDRPASWTSAHHIRHWFQGGTNDPPNLTLLCYRHHWNVHEGNWQIARDGDGRIVTIPPTVTFGLPRGPD